MKRNFVVITSINPPTEAVVKFAETRDWQLVVVGDLKTPADWAHPNVIYLSPEQQRSMTSPLVQRVPWKSYARKMAGYLYALDNGAEVIADTDDDNIPYADWSASLAPQEMEEVSANGYVNTYRYFCDEHVWPRGFPLENVLASPLPEAIPVAASARKVGVWQFLADEDPDVDAIYRLTCNRPIYFRKRPMLSLAPGALCPFNSQNTFFRRETFALLYLPVHVTFRFTDILRGLIAQPVLWASGYTLCFGHATVVQKRNPHNYLADFESEIPCYLHPRRITDVVGSVVSARRGIPDNLHAAYQALESVGIVKTEEMDILDCWLNTFR